MFSSSARPIGGYLAKAKTLHRLVEDDDAHVAGIGDGQGPVKSGCGMGVPSIEVSPP